MTRTERASYPRAINRDRSESKNAMDKSLPKHGAGPHNWGSYEDELDLETSADYDEEEEVVKESAKSTEKSIPVVGERRASVASMTEQDREAARKARLHALERGDIDLGTIARTSVAVSTSPPTDIPITSDANTSTLKLNGDKH
ncbi:hypothetical protein QCA50_016641 [Cerrena zonata]|uniref:Hyaluronan/mRNA-binding protein domain-containing protein n=1 Tax=Cerrena zonata TaxID=2478898 RepID=A0AAW0FSR1_9APHY